MALETLVDAASDFVAEHIAKIKEGGAFAGPKEVLELYETPTIELVNTNNEVTTVSDEITTPDGNANTRDVFETTKTADCDLFEKVETVTTVLGVDCEAGAIEGFKDLAEKLVTDEAAANIHPGHPLYELVQAQKAGDLELVNREAARLAQEFGFWNPDQVNESAALQPGTQFVLDDSGIFTVRGPDGQTLAVSDCEEVVTKYTGPMIDSGDCAVCETEAPVEPVTIVEPALTKPEIVEPVTVEQPDGPKIQTVEMCVAPGVCEQFESVLIFDSVEQAERFFSNPENVKDFPEGYQDSIDSRYRFFVIADGEGYVQCLPFRIQGDQMILETDNMRSLDMVRTDEVYEKVSGTRIRQRALETTVVGNMSEGVAEKYFNGYVGTDGPRETGGLNFGITKGEAAFPSAPMEFVVDPETGRYVLEPFNESVKRTYVMWIKEAGLSGGDWSAIGDMPLPEEFADPNASVMERAAALKVAAAERGVIISQENAEELTRIINEGALGENGGLTWDEQKLVVENNLDVSAQQNGKMGRLDSALLTASQNVTAVLRQTQGFSS